MHIMRTVCSSELQLILCYATKVNVYSIRSFQYKVCYVSAV
jgi:hypothetical protein